MARERSVAVRLAGFGLALVVAFGAAFGLGRAVGPLDDGGPPAGTERHQHDTDQGDDQP